MRVALCLSGQPRGLRTNIPFLMDRLVIPSGITDIFIHTWFDESYVGKPFSSSQPIHFGKLGTWDADTIQLLESLSPKQMVVEPHKDFQQFSHLENLTTAIQTQIASNAYSVYTSNELKSEYERAHNFKYDLVIRTRIDCEYFKPHNILNYLDTNWTEVLHVPYMHQHMREDYYYPTKNNESYLALSDTFAYGSSGVVDKFCSVFPDFEHIHNQIKPFQYAESFFGYQTRHVHRIPISMQHIEYKLSRK